ncbi:hypothetical protein LPTSP3_g31090 [Leptospira kobayashii]|uniref:Uncharacterized protein n=1 Tax=Leptospira kobayashii TaxID=1917830 RepID=A0ABN6KG44_9LEPT|nr:hypothetical protein [Leptospira kobayashii]BDA80179.1 hypothetical protein LPTSP3_g31090 [Leptospira kobayashii]
MTFKDNALNILTMGAYGKIKAALDQYSNVLDKFNILKKKHDKRKAEINEALMDLIESKKKAILELKKINKITKLLNIKQRQEIEYSFSSNDYSFKQIEGSITAGELALISTKGLVSGISTALGTWALVGNFGVASTGTAIGSLSGIAATNAILAWFGGGSIAAGGGGMLIGSFVVGGIIAVPTIAITGIFQHLSANKKIIKIKESELQVIKNIKDIKKNLINFNNIEHRSKEINDSLIKSLEGFQLIYTEAYKKIYKYGFFSKVFKKIKSIFTGRYFNKSDLAEIQILGKATSDVLKIVDTKIFEENNG